MFRWLRSFLCRAAEELAVRRIRLVRLLAVVAEGLLPLAVAAVAVVVGLHPLAVAAVAVGLHLLAVAAVVVVGLLFLPLAEVAAELRLL